jgi:hypothetical protein
LIAILHKRLVHRFHLAHSIMRAWRALNVIGVPAFRRFAPVQRHKYTTDNARRCVPFSALKDTVVGRP